MEKQIIQRYKSCIIQATTVRIKLLLSPVSSLCNVDGNSVVKQTLQCKERVAVIFLDLHQILQFLHCTFLHSLVGASNTQQQNLVLSLQRHLRLLESTCNIRCSNW